MKLAITCEYCGHHWKDEVWNKDALTDGRIRCVICKEKKHLKVQELTDQNRDVFGYRFSPPFPEKQPELDPLKDYWKNKTYD